MGRCGWGGVSGGRCGRTVTLLRRSHRLLGSVVRPCRWVSRLEPFAPAAELGAPYGRAPPPRVAARPPVAPEQPLRREVASLRRRGRRIRCQQRLDEPVRARSARTTRRRGSRRGRRRGRRGLGYYAGDSPCDAHGGCAAHDRERPALRLDRRHLGSCSLPAAAAAAPSAALAALLPPSLAAVFGTLAEDIKIGGRCSAGRRPGGVNPFLSSLPPPPALSQSLPVPPAADAAR